MTFVTLKSIQKHTDCYKLIMEIKYTDPSLFSEQEQIKNESLRFILAEFLGDLGYNVKKEDK